MTPAARRTAAAVLAALLLCTARTTAAAGGAGGAGDWPTAFSALCATLAREYPFSAWKRLDWAALERELAPRVARAAAAGDRREYYLALRELVWRLRDGHARLVGDDGGAERAAVGGSFGFAAAQLDDGRLLVSSLTPGGPAARAGIRFGAEIRTWNDLPIAAALAAVPVLWSERPPATAEGRRRTQIRLLARAPIGAHVKLAFRNRRTASAAEPTAEPEQSAELSAEASSAPVDRSPCLGAGDLFVGRTVEAKALAAGVGYVRLHFELPTLRTPGVGWTLRRALAGFSAAGLPGVVIDVRGNCGGLDAMVPPIVAPFLREALFYEVPGVPTSGGFAPDPRRAITVLPRPPLYTGRIAVLIDEHTLSAGEAIPLLLEGLPNVAVIGWSPTHGSFGIGQRSIRMPGGLKIVFPHAQSLDANGRVEVDGDANGQGGVAPDVRLPLSAAIFERRFSRGEDVALTVAERFVRGEPLDLDLPAENSSGAEPWRARRRNGNAERPEAGR